MVDVRCWRHSSEGAWEMTIGYLLWRGYVAIAAGVLALGLAGCETDGTFARTEIFSPVAEPTVTAEVRDPADVQYYPSDEPLRLGLEHFNRGHYGIAERYFRDAVEKAPRDATAWVGLAASYDRIGRFDLADRAYAQAIKLVGETTDILNNLGYSYMLRGDYPAARKKYLQALRREPRNPTIANNLWLLDSSSRAAGRSPDQ
jgi:Tfp pilus assembly protein PilF